MKLSISPEERDLVIDMFIHDHRVLAYWVVMRVPLAAAKHATVALAFNEDGDWSWRKLASFALFELKCIEAQPPLAPYEQDIRRIAERIYDAKVHGGAAHFGIDVSPEDTDRAAARRQLDEAYERAIAELAPYINDKRSIQSSMSSEI